MKMQTNFSLRLLVAAVVLCIVCLPKIVLTVSAAEMEEITIDSSRYPESAHNYANNANETKNFSWPGAEKLVVTFSTSTFVEQGYDNIYLYNDYSGDLIGEYTGSAAAGLTVEIPSDSFRITLTSDGSVQKYGYSFSSIVAYMPGSTLTFTLNENGNGYTVSDCDVSASGELVIPTIYNDLPITGIGRSAFRDCTHLTNITTPNSVTSIGISAFKACSGLSSITIPDSVNYIGAAAFECCTSLTDINIPDGITSIETYLFYGCESLTSITIPDSVNSIGSWAFSSYTSLTSIPIPDSVTSICASAFAGCYNLESVAISNSITVIGDSAFERCSKLTGVIYCGTQEEWDAITVGFLNEYLTNATLQFHNYENCICTYCQASQHNMKESVAAMQPTCEEVGVTAVYTCANGCGKIEGGEEPPALVHNYIDHVCTNCGQKNYIAGDINGNATVDQEDAVYLLLHTLFGEEFYPLKKG